MIPSIIYYCWFGEKPIPSEYQQNINSWKEFFPKYEIKEWNENNYDVHCIPFSSEAYKVQKFAYVSDYARLKILYEHGGIYFDTDVEVIKNIDDILANGAWMGIEKHTSTPKNDDMVNIGIGFATEPYHPIIKEVMSFYENTHYIFPDGHMEQLPIVPIVTKILQKHGMPSKVNKPINIKGITIYPWDYFCPIEFMSNKLEITKNTRTIHHYSATWMSPKDKFMMWKGHFFRTNILGRGLKTIISILKNKVNNFR